MSDTPDTTRMDENPYLDPIIAWVQQMAATHGGIVWDNELCRDWDWGQALVRAQYGPEWTRMDIDEPNAETYAIALQWSGGEWPEWAVREQTV